VFRTSVSLENREMLNTEYNIFSQRLSKEIALTINLIHCNKKRRNALCFEFIGQRNHECLDGVLILINL
jgi:hypothetical protein